MPHVAPVGWSIVGDGAAIEISGHDFGATKKFRDVTRTAVAAVVVDDVGPPWRPRGVEIRARAQALPGPPANIRIEPTRIVSWGIDGAHSRTVD
jgi:pyridoxamine 5'-phosphate oxidase family protein